MSGTAHDVFKPKPSKAETKAEITNDAARAIIGAEAERRETKTARLRQARLEAQALLPVCVSLAKPRCAKRKVVRGGRSPA